MTGRRFMGKWIMVLIFYAWTLPAYADSGPPPYLIEIDPTKRTIPPEEISRVLENHLLQTTADGRHRFEVREPRIYEKIVLPAQSVSCEVSLPEGAHRGGYVAATLRLLSRGEEVRRLRVTARIDVYADVVVARQYLKRHQVIKETDLQLLNRNISLLPPDVVTDMKYIVGKRTTFSINSNEVLRISMVEEPPLVRKGDRVLLLVQSPFFRITAMGESKEEGRRGERVKLLNLSSKKEVYGRVLDSKTVEIDF
ncbi:MAG: flagellar basal body P-ring formation chaperone FlgA [Thermodesulfobacteriota bacterium]